MLALIGQSKHCQIAKSKIIHLQFSDSQFHILQSPVLAYVVIYTCTNNARKINLH